MKIRNLAPALGALVLAVVILSFLVPAVCALLPVFAGGAGGAGGGENAIPWARLFSALRFTAVEALLSSLAAVAIGLPAAFLAARRNFPGRRFLLSLSGVPLCIPPVIIALAFVLFYGRQGYLNVFLMSAFGLAEPPVTFLYSLAGVVIAHGFYNFPVVLRTVSQVWERLSAEEEEAALILGSSPLRVFRTITLPLLSPSILAAASLVFLYCFFSFIIVLLFGGVGGTTLEVELYQAARSLLDFRLSGLIALIETLAAFLVILLYVYFQRLLSRGNAALKTGRLRTPLRGWSEKAGAALYMIFLIVFFIGPLASILLRSFVTGGSGGYSTALHVSLDSWTQFFGRPSFAAAFGSTVFVGLSVALVSTAAALFFALAFGHGRPAFRVLPFAPLAVSSVMLGFGWTLLVPRGNVLVLILAQSAMAWPFAWTQIQGALDRIPNAILDASLLLAPDSLDAVFRVKIPLALRGILSGAGFVFAISAGDASLPLVLSLRRFENLSLTLYRLAGSYRFSEACVCAVLLALLCAFVFFIQDAGSGNPGKD